MSGHSRGLALASLTGGAVLGLLLALSLGAPRRLLSLMGPSGQHRLDGEVSPGEYQFRWVDETSKLELEWSVRGDRLSGAISTPDTGWVAVGFGGQGPLMYGADIVIGYVDGRGAHLNDHFADTPTSHQPDTALGGRNDVLAGAGLQRSGGTTIEFERPLASRDSTDQPIVAGQTHLMTASSDADDFTAYHAGGRKAVALLDLFAGPPAATARSAALPDHLNDVQIFLATWTALLLLVGVHGLLVRSMEGGAGHPAAAEPGASPAALDMTTVLLVVFTLVEIGALAAFAVGVAKQAPIWLLGSTLALGLLALTGVIAAYSREFVGWDMVSREREDGIPW